MKPYIGVTGFTSRDEVLSVLDNFPKNSDRRLMIGVLASRKSVHGIPMKSKWGKRTPELMSISRLFPDDKRAINLVHFSNSDKEVNSILADMFRIRTLSGPNFQGFQLNMAWPEAWLIESYRNKVDVVIPDERIVLQIGQRAMEAAGNTPHGVVNRIYHYVGLVDAVLLDPSGGQGKPFDTERAREYLSAIAEKGWDLDLGVAGGLGPDSLNLVEPLVAEFPNLNIDAEGRLRNKKDELDINSVHTYILKSLALFDSKS